MASLTNRHPIIRAQITTAESRRLRHETAEVRRSARTTCRISRATSRHVEASGERRRRNANALGVWPYWAPATRELLTVLVVAQDA